MNWTFDTETLVNPNFTYVWGWSATKIDDTLWTKVGNTLDSFFEWCFHNCEDDIFYIHNLKFDGEFILIWLLKNGYVYDEKIKYKKSFKCLITDKGLWYTIDINHFGAKIHFRDSMKLLNFSIDKIAKDFNLPICKLKIDYEKFRFEKHNMTRQEYEYITHDTKILAMALKKLFDIGYTKLTISSQALDMYKKIIGRKNFNKIFPVLEIYNDIKLAYKGGWVYVNPSYKNKEVGSGYVLDYNSLYPFCYGGGKFNLPYGTPIYFEGEYKKDRLYNLYIQHFECEFILKKDMLPTIQIKGSSFIETEYLESSDGQVVDLVLTNIDLELFFNHYEVTNIKYIDGYMFRSRKDLFTRYVNINMAKKIQAKKEHNDVLKISSKLMLNSLYGKFGKNPYSSKKIPYINSDYILKFKNSEVERSDEIYIALACFVTSYARFLTISTSQHFKNSTKNGKKFDRFLYSDTDSIHFLCDDNENLIDILEGLPIDNYKLGYLKCERYFSKAKYLRQKCYIEYGFDIDEDVFEEIKEKDNKKQDMKVTIAGLPANLHKYVTFENFKQGLDIKEFLVDKGKLRPKHVSGGICLVPAKWSIK